ncbi:4-hydroxy-tetrahydrodipicolinate reductase [Candidatus Bathyarchaeota archaeon]|nr:MAG: 4-hydroxy-tetrahydrodipicolinate reductase [Candidatus Bathyarchaeota archaeon]
MIKICVAGAAGRMGSTLLREALSSGFEVVSGVEAPGNPNVGKTLREAGICESEARIFSAEDLSEAVREADVYISFTTPEAEVSNVPVVASLGKRIVMGTTGLSEEQMRIVKEAIEGRVPAVISPNYAIGVNMLFRMIKTLGILPQNYDFSIVEVHHTGKRDAPSGTAKRLGEIISEARGYRSVIHGREGISVRKRDELEILSVRAGGVPGVHDIIIAGQHEMIRIEHVAFSRRVFAQGALYAAEWVCRQKKPGVYSMDDVLGCS